MRAYMRFNELTNENYLMFALLHYDNPHCIDIKEYFEDVRKLKYIKRLFNRYKEDGVMKERLILNHLISFYNVFDNKAATRLLFFRVGTEYHSLLKTFLIFLNKMPEQVNENLFSSDIQLDEKIIEILRDLK
jgi:transcription initiation factor IIF auxiliary subunit